MCKPETSSTVGLTCSIQLYCICRVYTLCLVISSIHDLQKNRTIQAENIQMQTYIDRNLQTTEVSEIPRKKMSLEIKLLLKTMMIRMKKMMILLKRMMILLKRVMILLKRMMILAKKIMILLKKMMILLKKMMILLKKMMILLKKMMILLKNVFLTNFLILSLLIFLSQFCYFISNLQMFLLCIPSCICVFAMQVFCMP